MRTTRNWVLLPLMFLAVLAIAGCNTVKGVGTDIHDMAQNTQNFIEGK